MLPGEYEFNTADREIMEIMSGGTLDVKLPGGDWQSIEGPESFEVPEDSKFSLKIKTVTDYCCSFIK